MIKHTITFTDFNEKEHTENLHFHISKRSVLGASDDTYEELQKIGAELQAMSPAVGEAEKAEDINEPFSESRKILIDAVKTIIRAIDLVVDMAYGVRSDDGMKFVRTAEVIDNFKQSAAYDAFVDQMIGDPTMLAKFIQNLLAKDN